MDFLAATSLTPLNIGVIGVALLLLGLWLLALFRARTGNRRLQELQERLQDKENQLVQAQRMEAVGILAGSIVHNLNNLLAVILGHNRMALAELPSDSPACEDLERVAKAGHMASELVQEINDFYRQADQARKPTDLVPVVSDTLKLLRDLLPPTVEIREDLAGKAGPVMASATGVQQILMNLFSNSVQSIHRRQGIIEISVREERILEWHRAVPQDLGPGSYVKLTVTDNGRGMDPTTLDQIFNSYFSAANGGRGMGIGLSTVYRILQDHDGVTIPHSSPGRGTSFDLYFPLIAWKVEALPDEPEDTVEPPKPILVASETLEFTPPESDPEVIPAARSFDPGDALATVLLVDDQDMVARVTARGLQRQGYRVVTHTDGRRALADFLQTPEIFDVVITDQIMPHMSGVRLTRKIRSIRPEIPVILITGFRDSFNEQQAKEAGVTEFVLKPTSHRDLGELIQRVHLKTREGRA